MAPAKKAPGPYMSVQRRNPGTPIVATVDKDAYMATRACASCGITFHQLRMDPPGCPLCDATARIQTIADALLLAENENALLKRDNEALRSQVDVLFAIRTAMDSTNMTDKKFLIDLAKQYRDDKSSIAVRVVFGRPNDSRGNPSANGFLIARRGVKEMDAHVCESIGGRAIAGYLDEAMRTVGPPQAMNVLVKALNQYLDPGA